MEALKTTGKKIHWTEKQMGIAEAIASGEAQNDNKKNILRRLGYAEVSATKQTAELFTAKGVQNALISMGITPEKLLKPAVDALQANQTTAYQGEIYQSDVPDLTLRMKGADQIAEILGLKKQVIEQRTVNVNVEFEDINHLFGS